MNKTILIAACLLFFNTLFAQDLTTATNLFDRKEYTKAKEAVDKALQTNEAEKPDVWIWKHKIYWELGNSANGETQYPQALMEGFSALKKAAALPKGEEAMLKQLGIDYLKPFNTYYTTFINRGSAAMAKEQNNTAFENFVSAIAVSTYFYERKLISNPLDTLLVFYAGYTAMKAGNNANAEKYFKKITDNNCKATDLQIAYGWLTNYYIESKKNNEAGIVCEKGLQLYPGDEYLVSKKMEIIALSGDKKMLFKAYEDIIVAGSTDFSTYLGYGAELYDYVYVDEKASAAEKPALSKRMAEVLDYAIVLNSKSAEAYYVLGLYYTSTAMEKQATDKAASNTYADKSIQYLENAVKNYEAKVLKESQKEKMKTALQQLINLYKFRGRKSEQEAAEKKVAAL